MFAPTNNLDFKVKIKGGTYFGDYLLQTNTATYTLNEIEIDGTTATGLTTGFQWEDANNVSLRNSTFEIHSQPSGLMRPNNSWEIINCNFYKTVNGKIELFSDGDMLVRDCKFLPLLENRKKELGEENTSDFTDVVFIDVNGKMTFSNNYLEQHTARFGAIRVVNAQELFITGNQIEHRIDSTNTASMNTVSIDATYTGNNIVFANNSVDFVPLFRFGGPSTVANYYLFTLSTDVDSLKLLNTQFPTNVPTLTINGSGRTINTLYSDWDAFSTNTFTNATITNHQPIKIEGYTDGTKSAATLGKTDYGNLRIATDGTVVVDTFQQDYCLLTPTVECYGAKGDSTTNDQAAFQAMINDVGYIRLKENKTYNVESTITVGVQDGEGYRIIGNNSTIVMPPSASTSALFNVLGNDVSFENLNIRSVNTGNPEAVTPTIASSNWIGIQANTGVWALTKLKIENVRFFGLHIGVYTNDVIGVNITNTTVDSCLGGFLIEETKDANVNNFAIDRDTFGNKFYHAFYLNNSSDVVIDNGSIRGAGQSSATESGRAFNLNTTNIPTRRETNINISNVTIDSTGGFNITNHEQVNLNNIAIKNTYQEQIFLLDTANVVINGLTVDSDTALTSSIAIQLINVANNTISRAEVNGFDFNGPLSLVVREGQIKFSDGIFRDFLGQTINSRFINFSGSGYTDKSLLHFENVTFQQPTPHITSRWGRHNTAATIKFTNCNIDLDETCATFIEQSNTASVIEIDDKTTFNGVTALRDGFSTGSMYYSDNVSKTANYTTRGERIINITSGDTITISTTNINKYGHELTIFNSTGSGVVTVIGEAGESIGADTIWYVVDNTTFRMNGTGVDVVSSSSDDNVVVTVTTTTYTVTGNESMILVDDDTAGGAVTITLPTLSQLSIPRTIKKIGNTANVTIDTEDSANIDGSASATLTTQYESLTVDPDGTNWWIK